MSITWCCRDCQAAMESATVPDPPICPACSQARRTTELTRRRSSLLDELEAIEVDLARLGSGASRR